MNIVSEAKTTATNECLLISEDHEEEYDLGLHIASIFVLLIVSLLGALFSVLSVRVKRFHVNPIIINVGKFFGSGVILATGFVHMLPPAMESLTHPCLPDSWNVYSAYASLFAMIAALAMQFIEFIAHQQYHPRIHTARDSNGNELKSNTSQPTVATISDHAATTLSNEYHSEHHHHHHHHHHGHQHGAGFHDEARINKISTYLLEFGIALHSILIGLTLGTTTESFVALFVALTFHQFFEAIALGAQISRLEHISLRSVSLMVIFFALTTPIGIAIGIGIHTTTYNPESIASLLVNGILDAISGGILIYMALVNLINAEMGTNAHEFYLLKKRIKCLYFFALYAGVGAMAVIGIWA